MVSSEKEKESELMAHVEESFGQMYHERARLPLPPSAAAMWLSPARRRGKGMFSLDGLGLVAHGAIARELLLAVRRPRQIPNWGVYGDQFFSCRKIQEDLHWLGFITADEITGSWRDSSVVVALQRWSAGINKPDCPVVAGDEALCVSQFASMPQVVGHDFEIAMVPAWRQLLQDMADAVRRDPALSNAQAAAIRAANPAAAPEEPSVPVRAGLFATPSGRAIAVGGGVLVLGVVGYLIWRRRR